MNADTAADASGQPVGLRQAIEGWLGEFRPLLGAMSELAVSEARLAAVGLALMLAASVAVAIMAATAWTGAATALAFWLFDGPTIWLKTALFVMLLSVVGAGLGYLLVRRLATWLDFRATRQLLFKDGPATDSPERPSAAAGAGTSS